MEILRTVAELAPLVARDSTRALAATPSALCPPWARCTRATPRSSAPRAPSCTHVAVSLFVNPTQFGPNEDYARYPRAFEADCALAEAEGADVLFAPSGRRALSQRPRFDFCRSPWT